MKEVTTQNLWNFELGFQEGVNVPIWIYVAFQQNDRQHDQNLYNDTFVRLPFISAQVIVGTEKYPDSAFLINYNDDDYSQGYAQKKKLLKRLQKITFFNRIYLKKILRRLMMLMLLVIIYTLSIYDIRKFFRVLNQ